MKGRVFGSTDLVLSHDRIGVEGQPLTWSLLEKTEEQTWLQQHLLCDQYVFWHLCPGSNLLSSYKWPVPSIFSSTYVSLSMLNSEMLVSIANKTKGLSQKDECGEPHWTAVCCAGGSIRCPPWCPRSAPCSTPPLWGPDQGGLFHCSVEMAE